MTILKTPHFSRRSYLQAGLAAASSLALPGVRAAAYPGDRAVKLVVAYPTGGTSDIVSRVLAVQLGKQLGGTFTVENKSGAGGQIGTAEVARAAPDGYTIGWIAESPLTIAPHLGSLPYKFEDVQAVASVMFSPLVVIASPSFKGKTFKDAIEMAKAKPGSVSIGRTGDATPAHLMVEQLQRITGAKFTQVPYRGGGQMTTDAIAGVFDILIANPDAQTVQFVKSGKLNLLTVGSTERIDDFPDIQTLKQLGYGAANLMSTYGIIAPPKTPGYMVELLNNEVNKALKSPEMRKAIAITESIRFATRSANEFADYLKLQNFTYGKLIQAAGIKAS